MAKPHRPSLLHRGYLYAQARMRGDQSGLPAHQRRIERARDWRAGYLAALRDTKGR